MDRTVFFADKSVVFTAEPAACAECGVVWADREPADRAKILKILESHNRVLVVASNPGAAYAASAAQFASVEAAGGIVADAEGRWLMIRRNGRWDLPKGHVECGEDFAACAEREILEETGVCARCVRPLCDTLHAYWFPKTQRWELKRTHWFLLRMEACDGLAPQREEGIVEAAWCAAPEADRNLDGAFPTIRCVAAALRAEDAGETGNG